MHHLELRLVKDVDRELIDWIKRAYEHRRPRGAGSARALPLGSHTGGDEPPSTGKSIAAADGSRSWTTSSASRRRRVRVCP